MSGVAIVGGGIGGLAAAITLKQRAPELPVTILEASHRAGGVLETIYEAPYLIERSADNFATLLPDALELCKATGYTDELISPEQDGRQAFVLRGGKIYPIPVGFSLVQPTRVWPILTTKTLSWPGKIRLLAEYFVPSRLADTDECLQSFATRRLGREAFDYLVEPIVSGIFTADPAQLSMQATLPQFVKMEREHGGLIRGYLAARRQDAAAVARRASGARYDQFTAPRNGMTHWINHLVKQLPENTLRLNTRVERMERLPSSDSASDSGSQGNPVHSDKESKTNGWRLQTSSGVVEADAVIMALPARSAAQVLQSSEPDIASRIGAIEYASSAVAVLVIDRADITGRVDGFGLIVPAVEKRPVLAISYTSNKYPGRAPADQLLVRVFLGGALDPKILEQDDSQLLTIAQQQLREILGWQGKTARWQGL